jgi:hypothetical protein
VDEPLLPELEEPAPTEEVVSDAEAQAREVTDPFASVAGVRPEEEPPPGEETAFFIAQAGVNRRNPPWKMALLIIALFGIPSALFLLFARFHVGPLGPRPVSPGKGGKPVPAVTGKAVPGLKDKLLGTGPNATLASPSGDRQKSSPTGHPVRAAPGGIAEESKPSSAELQQLYGETDKRDVGPPKLQGPSPPKLAQESAGPAGEELKKVVDQTQPAFQFCIEQHMRKHPSFRGGKVNLIATVGSSGIVKRTALDRRDIDGSDLGSCLKAKAKRMVFSAFAGEDVDLQIPLILTTTL